MEQPSKIEQAVTFAKDNNLPDFKQSVSSILLDKIRTKLAEKKKEIAQAFFDTPKAA